MELDFQTRRLIQIAAGLGVTIALVRTGNLKPYLKKSEAYKLYGRKNVEEWLAQGALKPRKDGNHSACWRLDRLELEFLDKYSALLQIL